MMINGIWQVIAILASPALTVILLLIGYAKWTGRADEKARTGDTLIQRLSTDLDNKETEDKGKFKEMENKLTAFQIHCATHCSLTTEQLKVVDKTLNNGITLRLDKILAEQSQIKTDIALLKKAE